MLLITVKVTKQSNLWRLLQKIQYKQVPPFLTYNTGNVTHYALKVFLNWFLSITRESAIHRSAHRQSFVHFASVTSSNSPLRGLWIDRLQERWSDVYQTLRASSTSAAATALHRVKRRVFSEHLRKNVARPSTVMWHTRLSADQLCCEEEKIPLRSCVILTPTSRCCPLKSAAALEATRSQSESEVELCCEIFLPEVSVCRIREIPWSVHIVIA